MTWTSAIPQLDGMSERRKAKRKAPKKKKKPNKNNQADNVNNNESPPSYASIANDGEPSASVAGPAKNNFKMPFIVNGAVGRDAAGVQSQPESSHGAYLISRVALSNDAHNRGIQAFSSLQHTMRVTAPPALSNGNGVEDDVQLLSKDEKSAPRNSGVTFRAPSVVTTEDTIRASSVQSEPDRDSNLPPADQDEHTLFCQVHRRVVCQFDPGCCVHRPKPNCRCPPQHSCCCLHHSGDCCNCVFVPNEYNGAKNSVLTLKHGEGEPEDPNQMPGDKITGENGEKPNHLGPAPKYDTEALPAYVLRLLEKEEFCDSHIILRSGREVFYPIIFRTHKALIARSPFIISTLKSQVHQEANEIVAIAGDNFCMFKAFEVALQTLYGLALLDYKQLRSITLTSLGYTEETAKLAPFNITGAIADFALCYTTSGAFFQHRGIVDTGLDLTINLINWETMELILYFGVYVSKFAIFPDRAAGSDRSSPVPRTEESQEPQDIGQDLTQELERVWGPRLVSSTLEYVIGHMDAKFTLYSQAQGTCIPDRIPEDLRSAAKPALSNPKLAEVKFGSFESLEEQKPRPEIVLTSAMVICLPFKQLKEAFTIMGARRVLSSNLAQTIVVEREQRRLNALRIYERQRAQNGNQEIPSEVLELGFREFFTSKSVFCEKQNATFSIEISLEREWIGLAVARCPRNQAQCDKS